MTTSRPSQPERTPTNPSDTNSPSDTKLDSNQATERRLEDGGDIANHSPSHNHSPSPIPSHDADAVTDATDLEDFDGITFEVVEHEVADGKPVVSRGVYLAPNLITTISLLSGFFSILSSTQGEFLKASLAIFLSGLLDGADGRVARMLNAQSPFGEQYDSLADMLAFGVAPAILIYSFALKPLGRIGIACAFVFTACAAFRLARFNVQIGEVDKKFFIGLASPLAAILVTSLVMVAVGNDSWVGTYDNAIMVLCAVWVVVCGLLMVSNIKYYSFKEFDKKKVPFVALIVAVLVLGIVLYNIPVGILAIGVIYALSGIFSTLKYKMKT